MSRKRKIRRRKTKFQPLTKRLATLLGSVILVTAIFFLIANYPPDLPALSAFFFLLFIALALVLITIFPALHLRYLLLTVSYFWSLILLRVLHQLHELNFLLSTLAFVGLYFFSKPKTSP